MEPIEQWFKVLQGKDTVLIEQEEHFNTFAQAIKDMFAVRSLLHGVGLHTAYDGEGTEASSLDSDGTYIVKEQCLQFFFKYCSMTAAEDTQLLDIEERNKLFSTTGEMILTAYIRSLSIPIHWDQKNAADETFLPKMLPHHIYAMYPRQFFNTMKQCRQRLRFAKSQADIAILENKFKAFKNHVSLSQSDPNKVVQFKSSTAKGRDVFGKAWLPFSKRFKLLSVVQPFST